MLINLKGKGRSGKTLPTLKMEVERTKESRKFYDVIYAQPRINISKHETVQKQIFQISLLIITTLTLFCFVCLRFRTFSDNQRTKQRRRCKKVCYYCRKTILSPPKFPALCKINSMEVMPKLPLYCYRRSQIFIFWKRCIFNDHEDTLHNTMIYTSHFVILNNLRLPVVPVREGIYQILNPIFLPSLVLSITRYVFHCRVPSVLHFTNLMDPICTIYPTTAVPTRLVSFTKAR